MDGRTSANHCSWSACAHILFPGQWNRASEDFFESFRNYDEAGSPQRIQVLKYLVLANMLTGSEVNPFDSQETKPYKNDSQIKAMTDLVDAYQRREVHLAEKILKGMWRRQLSCSWVTVE